MPDAHEVHIARIQSSIAVPQRFSYPLYQRLAELGVREPTERELRMEIITGEKPPTRTTYREHRKRILTALLDDPTGYGRIVHEGGRPVAIVEHRDATPEQRARLQVRAVETLAAIHDVAAGTPETAFLELDSAGDTPLRRHFANERAYYEWVRQGHSYGVIERTFDWLEAHWPESAEAATPVVLWGDARIGNMLFQDFERDWFVHDRLTSL